MALQRAAGETGFVKWSQKAKHEGIQTGRPTNRNTCIHKNIQAHTETRDKAQSKLWNAQKTPVWSIPQVNRFIGNT